MQKNLLHPEMSNANSVHKNTDFVTEFLDLPEELLTLCACHILVWERIYMSQVCRALHKVLQGKILHGIKYGALEQVKNKHYAQAQLVDQYTEWLQLGA